MGAANRTAGMGQADFGYFHGDTWRAGAGRLQCVNLLR